MQTNKTVNHNKIEAKEISSLSITERGFKKR
jgi:hypothetical protein